MRPSRDSRRLLGPHALVKGGAELVQGYALAMRLGATIDDIADGIYAFPDHGRGRSLRRRDGPRTRGRRVIAPAARA